MPRAKDIQATALAVITFLIRPSIFLILGLIAGYTLGFVDAFRESDTIGNKAARVIYQMHPDVLSDGVRARASVIRDTVQRRLGVEEVIPPN